MLALTLSTVAWRPVPERCDLLARRSLLGGAAAAAFATAPPSLAASATASVSSREDSVTNVLGRVPCFVVCNENGQPYLTEVDEGGRRSGAVFLGLRDAAQVLDQVRRFDPSAVLAVVPLATVYLEVSKSSSEAAAARAVLPQPRTSTSSEMRLFRLQPLSDELSEEATLVPGSSNVPLFFEPSLFLTVEGAQRRPYFLRSTDLQSTWARMRTSTDTDDGTTPEAASRPRVRVVGLEKLLRQQEAGELEVPPLLLPPSETAEVLNVPRKSL